MLLRLLPTKLLLAYQHHTSAKRVRAIQRGHKIQAEYDRRELQAGRAIPPDQE